MDELTTQKRFSNSSRWDTLPDLVDELCNLATDYNIPVITASQAGRLSEDKEKVKGKWVWGSYAKLQKADVVIGLGIQQLEDGIAQGLFLTIKIRNGVKKYIDIPIIMNTNKMRIEEIEI